MPNPNIDTKANWFWTKICNAIKLFIGTLDVDRLGFVYLRETADAVVLGSGRDVGPVQQPLDLREDDGLHGRMVLQQKADLVGGLGSNTADWISQFVDLMRKYLIVLLWNDQLLVLVLKKN